jgi:glycosyltransferase involved in cell wall biosynthesis
MDVFVSASETESFGLAIVEAMAAGTAVVATATEGAQEVIDDQKTGLLVPIGDVKQIARSVVNLLSDPEKRERIAIQSAESAAKRFSLKRMVDEVEKIYS